MGFVKSVARTAAPVAYTPVQQSVAWTPSAGTNMAVQAFVAKWGLDGRTQQMLHQLDAGAQQRVMSGFAPPDVSRGASAAFMGFAKSVAGSSTPMGQIAQSPVDAFVAQWGLDAKAQGALLQLDPGTQQRVMSGFAPKDVSRGASAA